jgi:C-terminal processing protease CtpA/Prc
MENVIGVGRFIQSLSISQVTGRTMRSLNVLLAVVLMSVMIRSMALAQEISGIGVKLAEKNGQIVLDTVYPGTPADEAGLRAGEAILTINGKSIHGKTVQNVQKLLTGPSGSKVKLLIQDNEGNSRTVDATRKSLRASAEGPSDFIG